MKKIIIFAAIGIVALGLGVGGTIFFMGGSDEPVPEGEEAAAAEEAMQPEAKDAIYHNLHPAFVANFQGKSKKKFMQVYVVAMAYEQTVIDDMDLHMPAIRNNILMHLGKKTSDEVNTPEGKEMLRSEVLDVVRETLTEKTGEPGVEDLYFTSFVMQ